MLTNLRRIYIPELLKYQEVIDVKEKGVLHRLKNVLRLKKQDEIRVFNPTNGEFIAAVEKITNKSISLRLKKLYREKEEITDIEVIIPIIKPDNMKWMAEKATELGVSKFIFYNPSRSQIKKINLQKISHYIIGASEQSERIYIPQLEIFEDITEYIAHSTHPILLCNELEKEKNIYTALDENVSLINKIAVMIGPEGGFAPQEIERFAQYPGVISVHLGERILRSETAMIFALSVVYSKFSTQLNYPRCNIKNV